MFKSKCLLICHNARLQGFSRNFEYGKGPSTYPCSLILVISNICTFFSCQSAKINVHKQTATHSRFFTDFVDVYAEQGRHGSWHFSGWMCVAFTCQIGRDHEELNSHPLVCSPFSEVKPKDLPYPLSPKEMQGGRMYKKIVTLNNWCSAFQSILPRH